MIEFFNKEELEKESKLTKEIFDTVALNLENMEENRRIFLPLEAKDILKLKGIDYIIKDNFLSISSEDAYSFFY